MWKFKKRSVLRQNCILFRRVFYKTFLFLRSIMFFYLLSYEQNTNGKKERILKGTNSFRLLLMLKIAWNTHSWNNNNDSITKVLLGQKWTRLGFFIWLSHIEKYISHRKISPRELITKIIFSWLQLVWISHQSHFI